MGGKGDGAVVPLDDLLCNGEAEAGAAGFSRSGLVHPVKAVENAVAVFFRDTDTVIADLHPDGVCPGTGSDADMAAIGGIFDGVAENVHHDLLQAAAVAHDQR